MEAARPQTFTNAIYSGTPTFLWGLSVGIFKHYSEALGKIVAPRLSISVSFNYNGVFKNCTWNENRCYPPPCSLGQKNS